MSLHYECYQHAVRSVQADIAMHGISQRRIASHLGMTHSSFNNFMNMVYRKPNARTLAKIIEAKIWSEATVQALETLRDYDNLVLTGKTPILPQDQKSVAAE